MFVIICKHLRLYGIPVRLGTSGMHSAPAVCHHSPFMLCEGVVRHCVEYTQLSARDQCQSGLLSQHQRSLSINPNAYVDCCGTLCQALGFSELSILICDMG